MPSRYRTIDLSQITPTSIQGRESKVHIADFASPLKPGATVRELIDSLPHILAGDDLRTAIDAVAQAALKRRAVVLCFGAHVIKTGQAPVLIDLMRRGVISTLATNGASVIHDSEIALFGHTSEHVEKGIGRGLFGMMRETADFVNTAAVRGAESQLGFGEAVGKALLDADAPNKAVSLFAAAYEMKIPITVHVGVGTDIVHMHPSADGASIGDVSHRDFKILIEYMRGLAHGGALLNFGSAVVMPEVVLKALTVLRNLNVDMSGFTSVNMDFLQHYRSSQQIVERVREIGGQGVSLTGHHEIMIPLFAAGVLERLRESREETESPALSDAEVNTVG
ncbi:MAG: deoxyhypusine synthase family protein [Armatimonadetes bacterium]|nr:deoxyhypusine synthase family protein [Armatimonadota bacterium]